MQDRSCRISVRNGDRYYFIHVSRGWAIKHDNGALVSCGLTVGEDGFTHQMFKRLQRNGQVQPIEEKRWKHSGCQSSCTERGDKECRW